MDAKIRERMLLMVTEYSGYTGDIIHLHAGIATSRATLERMKGHVVAALAKGWAETKSNEQTRNAQVAEELLANGEYQDVLEAAHVLEEGLRTAQLRQDALRFERDILIAIANNEQVE